MKDWILQSLADRLDVKPPQAGEAISPRIRFEQPWEQWLLLAVVLGSTALIIWLYRREGKASAFYKSVLAALRIGADLARWCSCSPRRCSRSSAPGCLTSRS